MVYIDPYPFRFSPWKHHLKWMCKALVNVKKSLDNTEEMQKYFSNIILLNSNYIDLYTGEMMPYEILSAIDNELKNRDICSLISFKAWLGQEEFKELTLQDHSVWILREGIFEDHFIHVHPARFTPLSVRLHGNSYKTALILHILSDNPLHIDLIKLNQIRTGYLRLSPVKRIEKDDKIIRAITVVYNELAKLVS